MTQENLSTGFVAKAGYFQIKPVKSTDNKSQLSKLKLNANRKKQKLARCACLKVKSCFFIEQEHAGINGISTLN